MHTEDPELACRERTQVELAIAERLESVGRLAAGVAHEINTPIQYVSDSMHFIRDAVDCLLQLSERLRMMAAADANNAGVVSALSRDLPYLTEHLPKAMERSLDGLQRVTEIVRSMRELSHPDRAEMSEADLNHIVRNALLIARGEYKHVAEIELELATLPPLRCHPGELNQVILNLVVNAAQAIAGVSAGAEHKGLIKITTRSEANGILISIADSGPGIADHIRDRIFEPFFTTKEVGRGTGQGLAISRHIIVTRHGGSLDFDSEPGRGTVFHVRLPFHATAAEQAA